jgi:uncharacterized protein (TIGR01777 family)
MKIAITGASGFVGQSLMVRLALAQHECVPLPRNSYDIAGTDAVVHLAGEPVAGGRWNESTKKRILDSRVNGTRQLIQEIAKLPIELRPKTLICASAIGYYGDRQDETLTEKSSLGKGFLAEVVSQWEEEAIKAEDLGLRVIRVRLGVVLGVAGGALEKMQAVVLGSGQQWMSWIHLHDVTRFMEFALEHSECSGVYHLTAPNPVRNEDFTQLYAKATGCPLVMRTPAFLIRSALGEMSQIVLDSVLALPERTLASGFQFSYPKLEEALQEIYPKPLERRFSAAQFVPRSIEEVFTFFSLPQNLEELTPSWLNFRVLKCSTSEEIKEGTLIDYQLKIHGVPVRWKTLIESWQPGKSFVDTQLKGPYRKWHHTHRFEKVKGGTLLLDEVVYQVPGGFVGNQFGGKFIRKDIESIFAFRKKKIAELFSV